MYGIRLKDSILCKVGQMTIFIPKEHATLPVIRYSQIEIDQLLQDMTIDYNDYAMVAHKFTEDELMQFVFNRFGK